MDKHPFSPGPDQDPSRTIDPVEGRADGELWKRQRPEGEAPARSGGDDDVEGALPPTTTEEHKAQLGDRPAPGLLDANADATPTEEEEVKEKRGPDGPPSSKL